MRATTLVRWLLAIPVAVMAAATDGTSAASAAPRTEAKPRRRLGRVVPGQLAFPFRDVAAASELYCFGLVPWSADGEIHGGIDVAAARKGSQPLRIDVPVVAPAPGRVEWVEEGTTGAGLYSILVLVRLNDYWFVVLTIEPQSASAATNAAQRAALHVKPGDRVAGGAPVADLVVWNVAAGSYPHVHFGLLYKHPAETLEHIRDHILEIAVSDGTDLPPAQGPGSPLDPRDLRIATTFFCPYAFSALAARAAYDTLPAFAVTGERCACPCAYGSSAGDCGRCSPLPS